MKSEKLKVKNAIGFIVRRLGFRGVTSAIYHSSLVIRHSPRSQCSLFAKEIRYLSLVTRHFFLSLRQKSSCNSHRGNPASIIFFAKKRLSL